MSTSTIDIVQANFEARNDLQGELRQIDEAATADQRAYTDEEAARIVDLRERLGAIDDRITANLEMASRQEQINSGIAGLLNARVTDEGDIEDTRSLGDRILDDEAVRSWLSSPKGASGRIDTGIDYRAAVTSANLLRPGLLPGLGTLGTPVRPRRTYVQDILNHIPVQDSSHQFFQNQATKLNTFAPVAENAEKPEQDHDIQLKSVTLEMIAGLSGITRKALEDTEQLKAIIESELRANFLETVEKQVVTGNGSAPNLTGLESVAGVGTVAPGSAEPWTTSIRKAISVAQGNGAVPEYLVLNPADAEVIDLTNATSAGLHAVSDFQGGLPPTTWGLRRVISNAVTAGTALVIDPMGIRFLTRGNIQVYWTDSHDDWFQYNRLAVLLEGEVGLAVPSPKAITKITFNDED